MLQTTLVVESESQARVIKFSSCFYAVSSRHRAVARRRSLCIWIMSETCSKNDASASIPQHNMYRSMRAYSPNWSFSIYIIHTVKQNMKRF